VFALGQRFRRVADHIATTAEAANGARVRQGFQDKKASWYAVLEDPRMPVSSTLVDQAHHAMDRKLCMMQGFHHPGGSQQACLTGLAHRYNLVPYQPSGPACRSVWRGSGRRMSTDTRLVPQSANPHVRRLPLSGVTRYH